MDSKLAEATPVLYIGLNGVIYHFKAGSKIQGVRTMISEIKAGKTVGSAPRGKVRETKHGYVPGLIDPSKPSFREEQQGVYWYVEREHQSRELRCFVPLSRSSSLHSFGVIDK